VRSTGELPAAGDVKFVTHDYGVVTGTRRGERSDVFPAVVFRIEALCNGHGTQILFGIGVIPRGHPSDAIDVTAMRDERLALPWRGGGQ